MKPDQLVAAMRDIADGKAVIAPDLTPVLAELIKHGEPTGPNRRRPRSAN